MPTYDKTDQFKGDYQALSPEERQAFKRAVKKFVEDLPTGTFRVGLRVGGVRSGPPGVFEMTWEGKNGRATFQYGYPIRPDEKHIVWRRVGGHAIFGDP